MYKSIHIKGARVHNLKNIEVDIPHNKLVVVTGLSGSGKSTLAFDTIFAEGQRRYVESLSAYARQFLGRIGKPDVDYISGIAPAIAVEQKVNTRNPRSTVGTTTEIYNYLELLFARIGHTFSPVSGKEVRCYDTDDIAEYIASLGDGVRVIIAVPMQLKEGQGLIEKLTLLLADGIRRIYRNGNIELIEDFLPTIDETTSTDGIDIVINRIRTASDDDDTMSRIRESVSRALGYGTHSCVVISESGRHEFSTQFEADGICFERPTEHLFSFNNPVGACPKCEGYGRVVGIDENLVVPDKSKSIFDNAIACWRGDTMRWFRDQLVANAYKFDFPIHEPYYKLSPEQKRLLWSGNEYFDGLNKFFDYLDSEKRKIQFRVLKARYTGKTVCPDCNGSRLRKEALYVKVGGCNIAELVAMNIDKLIRFFDTLALDAHDAKTAERIIKEIRNRLQYLSDVGLGYLTLDRLSSTLSGGESQRINLATSLGSTLTGSLYILDEPSIGLHPRDTHRLIAVLKQLRDLGNTVIVVEHAEDIIRAADYIVDMGPEAGENGGRVVYSGDLAGVLKSEGLTADYLTGRRAIPIPVSARGWSNFVRINGARENNLKNITVQIPLGVMTCVTGVSGSGKSSLIKRILYPALHRQLADTGERPGDFDGLDGDIAMIGSVEMVDQNPIGKSSRSNPVTYIKAYDEIRKLFADQPYAVHSGIGAGCFSFNVPGGRCEDCQGEGVIKVGMQFMADVELVCETCGGKRFKDEILNVKYRDKNICDVLDMSIDEAVDFFSADTANATCRRIVERLKPLQSVGLGYIKLGQSSSTLSGGESQRVKLASFLSKDNAARNIMFIFDEPTTGLHFHDINKLLDAFSALIENGHTVVVVEHNMDIVKCADWVIDLGPEAGDGGGSLVCEGTPAHIAECRESYTGQFLRSYFRK
ncbi:MAG: excinuclease ABC subunit UvrA [Alistipes sp.]